MLIAASSVVETTYQPSQRKEWMYMLKKARLAMFTVAETDIDRLIEEKHVRLNPISSHT